MSAQYQLYHQMYPRFALMSPIGCVHAKSLQSCLTLGNSMGCSPPGSSVCGILQARILEWVAMPFSRGSSQPRNQTRSPAQQADSLPSEHQGRKPRFYVCVSIYSVFLFFCFFFLSLSFWLTSFCITGSKSTHVSTDDPASFHFC